MNDDEKLKDIFETKKTSKFDKVIIKAKILSIIRGAIISVVVIAVLGFILLYYNALTLNKLGNKKDMELYNFYNIAKPNSYIGTKEFDENLIVGELNFTKYRFIGSKAIYDGNYKESYTYIPLINGIYGDAGDYLFNGEAESVQKLYEIQKYNKIGRKLMKFYNPNIKFNNYINDLSSLNKIANNKTIEMSLSFDKSYTIDEVKNMIPQNITLNWFWVDSYDKVQIKNMTSNKDSNGYTTPNIIEDEEEVYGIKAISSSGEKIKNPENEFINTICNSKSIKGTYKQSYEMLFNKLSKDKKTIKKTDIKIIGVVVSGDVNLVKQLNGKPFIKASTDGAITDKY